MNITLEFDEVYISEDQNSAVDKILEEQAKMLAKGAQIKLEPDAELLLYYVACSRAKKSLKNAKALDYKISDYLKKR